jgi:hypothetical protein
MAVASYCRIACTLLQPLFRHFPFRTRTRFPEMGHRDTTVARMCTTVMTFRVSEDPSISSSDAIVGPGDSSSGGMFAL